MIENSRCFDSNCPRVLARWERYVTHSIFIVQQYCFDKTVRQRWLPSSGDQIGNRRFPTGGGETRGWLMSENARHPSRFAGSWRRGIEPGEPGEPVVVLRAHMWSSTTVRAIRLNSLFVRRNRKASSLPPTEGPERLRESHDFLTAE